MSRPERRFFRRFRRAVPLWIEVGGERLRALSHNTSAGGAYLSTTAQLEVGGRYLCRIAGASPQALEIIVEVIHQRSPDTEPSDGYGVRWVVLRSPQGEEPVIRFLESALGIVGARVRKVQEARGFAHVFEFPRIPMVEAQTTTEDLADLLEPPPPGTTSAPTPPTPARSSGLMDRLSQLMKTVVHRNDERNAPPEVFPHDPVVESMPLGQPPPRRTPTSPQLAAASPAEPPVPPLPPTPEFGGPRGPQPPPPRVPQPGASTGASAVAPARPAPRDLSPAAPPVAAQPPRSASAPSSTAARSGAAPSAPAAGGTAPEGFAVEMTAEGLQRRRSTRELPEVFASVKTGDGRYRARLVRLGTMTMDLVGLDGMPPVYQRVTVSMEIPGVRKPAEVLVSGTVTRLKRDRRFTVRYVNVDDGKNPGAFEAFVHRVAQGEDPESV